VVVPGDPRWEEFAAFFPWAGVGSHDREPAGLGTGTDRGQLRAIIVVNIDRIAGSCGYAVPQMDLVAERDLLDRWAERKSPDDLAAYRVKHNNTSIDGLPALG
jgi:hypothetical protein